MLLKERRCQKKTSSILPSKKKCYAFQFPEKINKIDNVFYWNFLGNPTNSGISFYKWEKEIHQLPTAYDSISYKHLINDDYAYDICYIGGRANNGFDEKYYPRLK